MLRGTITAIITPFDSNGAVDENALRKLVNFQIDNGIIGIVPCGTTGESPTLNHEEHNRVIDIVIQESRGKVPIIAGTGSNSTKEAIDLTRHAQESGADYSLQVAPYYNKPTQRGFYEHFLSIAETIDLPLIIYNIPGRTGKNIETDTLLRLAEHKNIAGVKEASGSISQIMDIISQRSAGFTVLSGDDNLTLPIVALGGDGVISVASNIVPKQVSELVDGALKGNWGEARRCHYRLLPLFKTLFLETNPIPIKTALAMKGIIKEVFRSPLCAMEPENREKLKMVLESQGIL
ncbi:MAG: 4-hydroxy-tetrahydrodipicolinate synthase [Deltaproteobacteria bacterium]|nr:4-hydroxy-tetrahydrodipicolinate synthase [Deltaproteobacteria bacterium]